MEPDRWSELFKAAYAYFNQLFFNSNQDLIRNEIIAGIVDF